MIQSTKNIYHKIFCRKSLPTAVFMLLLPFISSAQFYVSGDDPASARWYFTETPNYKIIYPQNLDSLAKVYGRYLEQYRIPVGLSAGFIPGAYTASKTPVILHPYNMMSNGTVAWAPKRMELLTTPQAYGPEPMKWEKTLAIHESRHVAQMQTGLSGAFRPFGWFFGEMFNGLIAGTYQSSMILEGDAVIAETALSNSGRGRTADFLNYYMIAFDNNDFRKWNTWRFPSQKHHVPNHYALGYLLFSGIRYIYGESDIVGNYFRHIARHPLDINGFEKTIKRTTGKNLNNTYKEIADTLHNMWQKEISARAPFMPSMPIVPVPKIYTTYIDNEFADGCLYSIKSSLAHCPRLVRIDSSGKEKIICPFSNSAGPLKYSPVQHRLWWSETIFDARWSQESYSCIRYIDLNDKKKKTLVKGSRFYYPVPSPSGKRLCVTEYPIEGGSKLVILDSDTGERVWQKALPDSIQMTESAWTADRIYICGISHNGFGIWETEHTNEEYANGGWKEVMSPLPVKISTLSVADGAINFLSDRNGSNELYRFDIASGKLLRLTSTRYGGHDFCFNESGDTLYFSASGLNGALVEKIPTALLPVCETDIDEIHKYKIADELSRQEREITGRRFTGTINKWEFSAPKRYRKVPHLFKVHSWAPFYFNVDNIMNFSYDNYYELASLGAAAVCQNDLGTAITNFGYSAHKDPFNKKKWRHSGHLDFTYSGLYPVFEISLDVNDRAARRFYLTEHRINTLLFAYGLQSAENSGIPLVSATVSTYIPFNLSSGGWIRGIIPRLSYSLSNDYYYRSSAVISYTIDSDNNVSVTGIEYPQDEKKTIRHRLIGSFRAYSMRPTASSGVYPQLGIGVEAGVVGDMGLNKIFAPTGWAYIYGYIPGIVPQQGLKLSSLYRTSLNGKSIFCTNSVNTLPRGLSSNSYLVSELINYDKSAKLTADYAIPIYIGDLNVLGSFMFIKRLILTPHFDYMFIGNKIRELSSGGLFSVGGTLTIDLKRLFWMTFDFNLGVTYSYNGGRSFKAFKENGIPMGRHYVGPVFSINF